MTAISVRKSDPQNCPRRPGETERSSLIPNLGHDAARVYTDPESPSHSNKRENKKHHNIAGLTALQFRLVCFSIWSGTFLGAFDSTLVSTLLSDIGSDFGASTQVSWLGTAYLLSVCSFTPIYGRLSDLIGRGNAHLTAMFLFTLGTLLCGIAPNMYSLIAARAIAGMGGGGVQSMSAIIMSDMVDLRHRGLFQGYVNILFGTGAALGGPVGGWISDHSGWRVAFNVQVPLLMACAACSYTFLRLPTSASSQQAVSDSIARPSDELSSAEQNGKAEKGSSWPSTLARIDYLGSLTLIIAVGTLLLSMSIKTSTTKPDGSDYHFSDPLIYGLLLVSAAFTTLFVLVEGYYSPEPILPLQMLVRRTPLAVAISSFTMVMAQFSVLYNIPLFFTIVQNQSSSNAGAHLLPNSILIGAGSLYAGWRMRHTGKYWWLGIGSSSLMVLSSIGMLFWNEASPSWLTWLAQAPGGFGYAGVLTTSLVALMTHVTRAGKGEIAVATSMTYLFRTVGQVLGVAISAAIVQAVVQKDLIRDITGPDASKVIYQIRHSTSSIQHLPEAYRRSAIEAYDHALHIVFIFNLALSALTVLSLCLIREEPMDRPQGDKLLADDADDDGEGDEHDV
ncbi:multidrug resistance protein fnx1 [Kwoniella heveanensis CBS 569]|nr:multidrug resistance protein fnx1 [Kwoniella heveanensis CBS 569]